MNTRKTAVALLLFVSFLIFVSPVRAVTPTSTPVVKMEKTVPTATGAMEVDGEASATVEYTLPYPGILPDHPLYFLKRIRDQIFEKFISDPVRKIEFYMLQADKSINMGVFLMAKQNETLALETMTKSKTHLEQSMSMAASLKAEGKEIPGHMTERFGKAAKKYSEVVADLAGKASDAQKANYVSLLQEFIALQEQAVQVKN
jgi:hypothetical protein